jgi:hypothetical protein
MTDTWRVIAKELRVRSGPGTQYPDAAEVASIGDILVQADQEIFNGWVPILLEDDSVAWVSELWVEPDDTEYTEVERYSSLGALDHNEVIFQSELVTLFGYPSLRLEGLGITDLTKFAIPGVKDWLGAPWSWKIYGHRYLEVPLSRAFTSLIATGTINELRTYDGCFNIRKMKGGGGYSVHSWGLAVDFNAALNPYGGPVRFSDEFIDCFKDAGFEAGAWWNTPDGMHFQLPWTRDWRKKS